MSLPHSSNQRKTNSPDSRFGDLVADQCAVLTGSGRAAIAVIGLRGQSARQIVSKCFDSATSSPFRAGQIRYGQWTGPQPGNAEGESVVVTPIVDDQYEIHCHGGSAAIERIVGDLQGFGTIRIDSKDWNQLENQLVREARNVLSQCLTARTAAVAMDQVRGAMVDWAIDWVNRLNEPATDALDTLEEEARQIIAHAVITTRLTEPFRVVLVGPPNVGKSSLLNAIVGYDRSITFDQAGTTRDVLHADTVIDGLPIRLSDTAGIRESNQEIEKEGIARARAAAVDADLVLAVSSPDMSSPLSLPVPSSAEGGEIGLFGPAEVRAQVVHVFNKIDLLDPAKSDPAKPNATVPAGAISTVPAGAISTVPAGAISTNALGGDGIPDLLGEIAGRLGRRMPDPGGPVPINRRQADRLNDLLQATTKSESLRILSELLGEDD